MCVQSWPMVLRLAEEHHVKLLRQLPIIIGRQDFLLETILFKSVGRDLKGWCNNLLVDESRNDENEIIWFALTWSVVTLIAKHVRPSREQSGSFVRTFLSRVHHFGWRQQTGQCQVVRDCAMLTIQSLLRFVQGCDFVRIFFEMTATPRHSGREMHEYCKVPASCWSCRRLHSLS